MAKRDLNILIGSIGSASGLNILYCLKDQSKYNINFIGIDCSEEVAAKFFIKSFYTVPKAKDPSFIGEILKICDKEKIDIYIPTMSFEYEVLCKNIDLFTKNNIKMCLPPIKTWDICSSKLKTDEYLRTYDILLPRVYDEKDLANKSYFFPLMVKPVLGRSSVNTYKVNNEKELTFFREYVSDPIIQEYISGKEYTIDTLCDLDGNLLAYVPRVRLETKSGLAVKSKTVEKEEWLNIVEKVTSLIKLPGISNIQCIKDANNKIHLIEINSRLPAGGLPLSLKAGINMPLVLVDLLLGEKYTFLDFKYQREPSYDALLECFIFT